MKTKIPQPLISQDLREFLISLCSSREAIHRYGCHRQLIHQVQRTIQVSYKYLDCALTRRINPDALFNPSCAVFLSDAKSDKML